MEIRTSHTVIEFDGGTTVNHYGYHVETDKKLVSAVMFWSREERERFEAVVGHQLGEPLLGRRLGAPAAVVAFGYDEAANNDIRGELARALAELPKHSPARRFSALKLIALCRSWKTLESELPGAESAA